MKISRALLIAVSVIGGVAIGYLASILPIGVSYEKAFSNVMDLRKDGEQTYYTSSVHPLPALEVGSAEFWMTRYMDEMRRTPTPFYGMNFVDVHPDNFEAIMEKIKALTEASKNPIHILSAAEYQDTIRITWVIYYKFFPPLPMDTATMVESLGDSSWPDTWDEFAELAIGYTWWTSPVGVEGNGEVE